MWMLMHVWIWCMHSFIAAVVPLYNSFFLVFFLFQSWSEKEINLQYLRRQGVFSCYYFVVHIYWVSCLWHTNKSTCSHYSFTVVQCLSLPAKNIAVWLMFCSPWCIQSCSNCCVMCIDTKWQQKNVQHQQWKTWMAPHKLCTSIIWWDCTCMVKIVVRHNCHSLPCEIYTNKGTPCWKF